MGEADLHYINCVSFSSTPANAIVCPALFSEMESFLLDPTSIFNWKLQKFHAPPEAVKAKTEVQKCVDKMPFVDRLRVAGAAVISPFFTEATAQLHARREGRVLLCGGHRVGVPAPLLASDRVPGAKGGL